MREPKDVVPLIVKTVRENPQIMESSRSNSIPKEVLPEKMSSSFLLIKHIDSRIAIDCQFLCYPHPSPVSCSMNMFIINASFFTKPCCGISNLNQNHLLS